MRVAANGQSGFTYKNYFWRFHVAFCCMDLPERLCKSRKLRELTATDMQQQQKVLATIDRRSMLHLR